MPRFKYVAMDPKGQETSGVLDAASQSQAVAMIRSKGFFPTRVAELGGQKKASTGLTSAAEEDKRKKRSRFMTARVKPKQLMIFTRQLATLIDAGLTLLRGLRILLKQEKHPALREALTQLGESIESGSNFSEALAQFPKIFDDLYVNMVRAGEAGGVLDKVLNSLAEFMEKSEKIKNKVKGAMVYPIIVMVIAVGILGLLLTTVIPKFKDIFDDLLEGKALPPLTQFVVDMSDILIKQWYLPIGVVALVVVGFKLLSRHPKGQLLLDRAKLKMPLLGNLVTKSVVSRFARTLGTLMSSGVPVLQALGIVRDTSGNKVIAKAIQQVHDSVKEGDTMAMPMEGAKAFPEMVVSMVDVGEETGALPEMLLRVADAYDDEVDTAVEGLTSIIEPVMIVFLAVIVGTIVVAMFVPLISIIGQLGGGA